MLLIPHCHQLLPLMRYYSQHLNTLLTSGKCLVSAKLYVLLNFHPLTPLPPDSPFFPLPACLSGPAAAWLTWLCSASSPFPPTPLWMSTVGGLLQVFCGEGGGLSFACPPPPPPWRSFSRFCKRSYVLLVLSSLWTNGGRPCWEWVSVETEGQKKAKLRNA